MSNTTQDMNKDPISGAPGAHPVGVGLGGAGGAMAGAAMGSFGGPIGALIGGAVGAVAGAAAGKGVAERMDPTGEAEYWRTEYAARPYFDRTYTYDDYAPAYALGSELRSMRDGDWKSLSEPYLRAEWEMAKGKSRLTWDQAQHAARDAFARSDRTYRAYGATDRHYAGTYRDVEYYNANYDFDSDYKPAYRYGTYARSNYSGRNWDQSLESDLERGWENAKGTSRLAWSDAKGAVRDAWHGVERVLPGDADGDGR